MGWRGSIAVLATLALVGCDGGPADTVVGPAGGDAGAARRVEADAAVAVLPAPGWLCCSAAAFGEFGPGLFTQSWQFSCQNPDGGRIPLFFPPPVEPDAGG